MLTRRHALAIRQADAEMIAVRGLDGSNGKPRLSSRLIFFMALLAARAGLKRDRGAALCIDRCGEQDRCCAWDRMNQA